jgi:hypothetical protein
VQWDATLKYEWPSIALDADELPADCFAGATLFRAAEDGTLLFEDGDQKEIAAGLSQLGDENAWTDPAGHGDSFQRIDWFDAGRTSGVRGMLRMRSGQGQAPRIRNSTRTSPLITIGSDNDLVVSGTTYVQTFKRAKPPHPDWTRRLGIRRLEVAVPF